LLLHQVFLNLMMNAEQAAAAKGRPGRINLGVRFDRSSGRVRISIRDSGFGLGDEALTHMFEPFYTTKAVGEGTGLGLAVAYGIVQDHGGGIAAANHRGGGAELTVELPARPVPAER
jgi:C4-dicarboxylate-specific signal transduction histidine kinase